MALLVPWLPLLFNRESDERVLELAERGLVCGDDEGGRSNTSERVLGSNREARC